MKDISKNNVDRLSLEELELLIERYFEGETSNEEELRLRKELCVSTYRSRLIDECLVAMGYFSIGKRVEREKKARAGVVMLRRVAGVAAMIAVVLVLGLTMLRPNDFFNEGDCVAYVNGEKISDKDVVITLIANDLSCMNEAISEDRNSILEEFSAIKAVLNE